jgi:oxygen-independent coproporphyrinogen-3 oxidase
MTTISLPLVQPSTTTAPTNTGSTCASAGCESAETSKPTTVGNYFVANYPPFGFWTPDGVGRLNDALNRPPTPGVELGLYAHIPFCRKRCHFCYFRVYTDKNAGEIRAYIDALLHELAEYARRPIVTGSGGGGGSSAPARKPSFIYFGGGTPSYLSVEQLLTLTEGMKRILPWDEAREVAFEAEPGTLNEAKLKALRSMGVTRLSLGIEHFDDHVLETNGRAHRSKEILRAYAWARDAGFAQINVDLIAGMVEETDERWRETVERTLALAPDSVTIYQMEVPYNTTIYQRMKAEGKLEAPVASWETKRRWVREAFARFEASGYSVTSATTVARDATRQEFLYRKGLFDGTDLIGVGVSAFGHVNGVNYQNQHDFGPYIDSVRAGRGAAFRAYALNHDERYIREFGLQLKGGSVSASAFAEKFGRHPLDRFATEIQALRQSGHMFVEGDRVGVTRSGLMEVDRLIFNFFRPEHRTGRFA